MKTLSQHINESFLQEIDKTAEGQWWIKSTEKERMQALKAHTTLHIRDIKYISRYISLSMAGTGGWGVPYIVQAITKYTK